MCPLAQRLGPPQSGELPVVARGARPANTSCVDRDRDVLRELGRQLAEVAALPAQQQPAALWRQLNGLRPARPMVMIDQIAWHEMEVEDELTLRCGDSSTSGSTCAVTWWSSRWSPFRR